MPEPWKWGFTPGERSALLLICAALLLGLGFQTYQQYRAPRMAPLTREDSLGLAAIAAAAHPDSSATIPPTLATDNRLLDINNATSAQLEALPGIGPALAKRIIAARDSLGRFKKPEDLLIVPGIGPKRVEKIRPLVTFSASNTR